MVQLIAGQVSLPPNLLLFHQLNEIFSEFQELIHVKHFRTDSFWNVHFADNIFTLRQWCSNNFPEAKEQLEHLYKEVRA